MKHDIEEPSSTVGKNKKDWLNRGKDKSEVINRKKSKDPGPTFTLETYNRFNVLKSDDDEHEIKISSEELLCGELKTTTREILEVGDPLAKNKVISANKLSLLLSSYIEFTLIFLLLILYLYVSILFSGKQCQEWCRMF